TDRRETLRERKVLEPCDHFLRLHTKTLALHLTTYQYDRTEDRRYQNHLRRRDPRSIRSRLHQESGWRGHLQTLPEKYQSQLGQESHEQIRVDRGHKQRHARRAEQGTLRQRSAHLNPQRSATLLRRLRRRRQSSSPWLLGPQDHNHKPWIRNWKPELQR